MATYPVQQTTSPPTLSAIEDLHKRAGVSFIYDPRSDFLAKNPDVFWLSVAFQNRLIASLRLSLRVAGIAFVSNFVVDPEFQSKGIGSKLLEKAETLCLKRNESMLVLESAKGAESYYLKKGFTKKQPFPPTFVKLLKRP